MRPAALTPAPPTDRQAEVLAAIVAHVAETGSSPTLRELGAATGIASPNGVMAQLTALHKKGLIVYHRAKRGTTCRSRGIVVPALDAAVKTAAKILLKDLRRKAA